MTRYSTLPRRVLPPILAAALCLGAPAALAQQTAPQRQPQADPPTTILIPPADERRKITTGDPLRTAPRPEDTATVPLQPVDPGLDGDAPSKEIPVPRFDLMPGAETADDDDAQVGATGDGTTGDGPAAADRASEREAEGPAPGT